MSVCVSCREPLGAYFEIMRYDGPNTPPKNSVAVCSLVCLIKWAYMSASVSGMRIAFGAKNTIDSFLASLKGSK